MKPTTRDREKVASVSMGWTRSTVLWNTVGTVLGALVGCCSLVLAIAMWLSGEDTKQELREKNSVLETRIDALEKELESLR
jgi:hypothetical protein